MNNDNFAFAATPTALGYQQLIEVIATVSAVATEMTHRQRC